MVAGKPAGGLSGHAGRDSAVAGHKHKPFTPHQKSWHVRKNQNQPSGIYHLSSASCRSDRIGEAAGSLWPAFVLSHDRGEPIGVVKLLGC